VYAGWPIAADDGEKRVWARFTDCNGNQSPAVITDTIVLDQTLASAPTLTGTPRNNKIDLDWTAAVDPGASASGIDRYRVYRSDKGGATPLAVVTDTSYSDNGLTSGQAYTYWVTAVDRAGNESSPESNHYTGTPG
jgi:fibronectin type 3 domain-containing protein